jgi:hypothetical protein
MRCAWSLVPGVVPGGASTLVVHGLRAVPPGYRGPASRLPPRPAGRGPGGEDPSPNDHHPTQCGFTPIGITHSPATATGVIVGWYISCDQTRSQSGMAIEER